MLHLKRVINPYEWIKCQVSGLPIVYGEYYYEDDKDGYVVRADIYKKMERTQKEQNFDYSKINNAKSIREYTKKLKEIEEAYLASTLLSRKRADIYYPEEVGDKNETD